LLVLGAAGSVGMIATQLAVSRGATIVGTASPRDHDLVREAHRLLENGEADDKLVLEAQ